MNFFTTLFLTIRLNKNAKNKITVVAIIIQTKKGYTGLCETWYILSNSFTVQISRIIITKILIIDQ